LWLKGEEESNMAKTRKWQSHKIDGIVIFFSEQKASRKRH
jgi:hypothetical protein